MAKLKEIIGEELFKMLPEEKQKEFENKDYEDISNGPFIPKQRFDKVNEESKTYKKQAMEREQQILELKNQYGDIENLKSKIIELENESRNQKESYEKELENINFNNLLEKNLDAFNVKDKTLIMTLLNKEALKVDGENILGLKEQMETIKKERDYLFEKEVKGTSSFSTGGGSPNLGEKRNFAAELGKEKAAMQGSGIANFIK
ncbi:MULTISPECIES: phage scaffolding protein [unclassified Clostridium]|uniref:phage scaffolding protein n=1 Tax=unclassified Clostridium TaxID=2614128 RepID=UPI0002981EEF|nr:MULTISPECIES: phage scaffolding protein [unclassified Clostridium]EKQ52761.1 MAG: Phage minor structural protein GP20 [Clostridium sp. Maddingley MBC34-26]